jgi:hypothetical protein
LTTLSSGNGAVCYIHTFTSSGTYTA